MRIASASVIALDVPLKKPFGISGGAQVHANNVLVELVTSDGTRAWGEGAPFPAFNGETQDVTLAACRRVLPLLEGLALDEDDPLRERIGDAAGSPSARCAIETAIFDARARVRGVSLREYLGGAETALVTDITITTGTVGEAVEEARAFRAFRTLKMKVGGGDLERDVSRVLAVRAERPDAELLVDANAGFTFDEALRFAQAIARAEIALFEQPVAAPGWDELAELRRRTKIPIAIDESVTTAADVTEAKRRGAADAANMKIMKSGLFEGLAIARRAREEGLWRMIGGMVETRLAMGTSACIAAGLGGFRFVDLDTPLFLAEDPFTGGYRQDGEHLDLAGVDRGHGMAPLASRA